jgi:hypothetical protein
VSVRHFQLTPGDRDLFGVPPDAEPRSAATPMRCRAHLFPCKEHRAARLPVGFNVTVPRRVSSSVVMRHFSGRRLITTDKTSYQAFSWAS